MYIIIGIHTESIATLPEPATDNACKLLLVMRQCLGPVPVHELCSLQLFYSFFKSLVGKEVIVELKNDLRYETRFNLNTIMSDIANILMSMMC